MKEKADLPAQISETDLDRPNPATPGDTAIDGTLTQEETRNALQPEPTDTPEAAPGDPSGQESID